MYLLFEKIGERIAAQSGILGAVNMVNLKKPLEFSRNDALDNVLVFSFFVSFFVLLFYLFLK
jgi:hypothetical protein